MFISVLDRFDTMSVAQLLSHRRDSRHACELCALLYTKAKDRALLTIFEPLQIIIKKLVGNAGFQKPLR